MTTKPNRAFFLIYFLFLLLIIIKAQGSCVSGCNLALASYTIWQGANLTYISKLFGKEPSEIMKYNPNVKNPDVIQSETQINVPFSCECLDGVFQGHTFSYTMQAGNTYKSIAKVDFSNLTTEEWVTRVNSYKPNDIPIGVKINVTINCSCGDERVSKGYGLFLTYPLRPGDDLRRLAVESGVSAEVLQGYNAGADFSSGNGLVFLPAKGKFIPSLPCCATCTNVTQFLTVVKYEVVWKLLFFPFDLICLPTDDRLMKWYMFASFIK